MRFSVFLALLMATFVVSCGSFISAESYALDDYTKERTEVRRLRAEGNAEEERGKWESLKSYFKSAKVPAAADEAVPEISDENLTKQARKIFDTEKLHKLSKDDMAKLFTKLATMEKEEKKKWSLLMRAFVAVLIGAGIGTAVFALYQLLTPYGA